MSRIKVPGGVDDVRVLVDACSPRTDRRGNESESVPGDMGDGRYMAPRDELLRVQVLEQTVQVTAEHLAHIIGPPGIVSSPR